MSSSLAARPNGLEDGEGRAGRGRLLLDGRPEGKPLFRGWLHLAALVATLAGGPLLIASARSATHLAELSIYVTSLVFLFGVSATYHRINWAPGPRRLLKRLDHATIFFAIAGSYSAIGGLSLSGWALVLILSLVWSGAVVGIVVRQCWLDAPSAVVGLPYVATGWCALAVLPQLERGLGPAGFALVLVGGVFYSLGAGVYATRRPDPWPRVFGFHEVFHAFTVLGAAAQFAAIAVYALPAR
ncbi:MAG: hemolysin III family protein [Actinomycetota bacterium]|nr:hemolysin III family protein [Actinomycetota bacterium]